MIDIIDIIVLMKKCIVLTITYAGNTQKLDAHSILANVMKCPAKSKRKPPVCNFNVSICIWVIFKFRIRATGL